MKKILSVIGVLVVLGAVFYFAMPMIGEIVLDQQCNLAKPSTSCLHRLRAAGHLRSQRGDLVKAQSWYERAAEHGDPVAMFHLAWVYEELARPGLENVFQDELSGDESNSSRIEVERHWESARLWYERSSKMGFAPSMNNLGQLYLQLQLGGADSEKMAFRWHLASAKAGNPVGIMNVGLAYMAGQGVEQDRQEGERWLSWTPSAGVTSDFAEPTFGRTKFFGSVLSEEERSGMRASAKYGEPIKVQYSDMKSNSELPAWKDVVRKMKSG